MVASRLAQWSHWRQLSDLLHEVQDGLLAHLKKSVTRSVEIDHERDDPSQDDNQNDRGEGAAPQRRHPRIE